MSSHTDLLICHARLPYKFRIRVSFVTLRPNEGQDVLSSWIFDSYLKKMSTTFQDSGPRTGRNTGRRSILRGGGATRTHCAYCHVISGMEFATPRPHDCSQSLEVNLEHRRRSQRLFVVQSGLKVCSSPPFEISLVCGQAVEYAPIYSNLYRNGSTIHARIKRY